MALVIAVPSFNLVSVEADITYTDITYDVTYCQTDARTILDMINDFRTGSDAWYWNEDNTTKTTLTNLSELTYDYDLEAAAMQRAAEIAVSYSHTRPDGSSCFTVYSETSTAIVTFYVGENIAAGYTSAAAVFEGWQETNDDYDGQGHRRNMLNSNFSAVGIACVYYDGVYYWVQEFSSGNSGAAVTTANDSITTVTSTVSTSNVSSATLDADPSSYVIVVGDTDTLPEVTATIVLTEGWPKGRTHTVIVDADYSISDTSIAEISGSNIVGVSKGTTELKISALGESTTVAVQVKPTVANCTLTVSPTSYTYDGTAKMPALTVKDGTTTLTEGMDYTVAYLDNTDAGTATATITGIGEYTGTNSITFTINQADISSSTAEVAGTYTYDGTQQKPAFTLTYNGMTLVEGTDYTITSYGTNIDAGEGTVTVAGKGNYTGTKTITFTINQAELSDSIVTLNPASYTYDGDAKTPSVTVKYGTLTLTSGTDYTYTYSDNTDAGTATVTVTAIANGNYIGSQTASFTIGQASLSGATVEVSPDAYTFDGSAKTPSVTVSYNGKTLTAGTDYTASYSDNTNAGTASVSITAVDGGNFTDSTSAAFTISKASLSDTVITLSASEYTYDGTAKTPSLTVKLGSYTLTEGVDYTVTYANNTNAGTATATITAVANGNFSGINATSFTIDKAVYTPGTYSVNVVAEYSSETSVDILDSILSDGSVSLIQVSGTGAALIDETSLEINAGVLTFNTTAMADGTTAQVLASVTGSANYEDYDIAVNVTASELSVSASGDVSGYTDVDLSTGEVITVEIDSNNAVFADTLTSTDSWITNLPAGLSQMAERVSDTEVSITISGAASTVFDETAAITIPAGNIENVTDDVSVSGGSISIEQATYIVEFVESTYDTYPELTYGYANGTVNVYTFKNSGNQPVEISDFATTGRFIGSLGADSVVNPGENFDITVVVILGLSAGEYNGSFGFTWNNGNSGFTFEFTQVVNKATNYLTISAEDKTYDGTATTVNVVDAGYGADDVTLTYYDSEGVELSGAPVEVGTYSVVGSIAESDNYTAAVSNTATFTISEVPAVVTPEPTVTPEETATVTPTVTPSTGDTANTEGTTTNTEGTNTENNSSTEDVGTTTDITSNDTDGAGTSSNDGNVAGDSDAGNGSADTGNGFAWVYVMLLLTISFATGLLTHTRKQKVNKR